MQFDDERACDDHSHDGGLHYGWKGHDGHRVHQHDARGRVHWWADRNRDASGLRLYLWRDVLRDYSAGMAFAIATSADDARNLLRAQVRDYHSDFDKEPEIHELIEPFAAHVHGGG